jgi:hypothetical protein
MSMQRLTGREAQMEGKESLKVRFVSWMSDLFGSCMRCMSEGGGGGCSGAIERQDNRGRKLAYQ